jgi:hypothetical protein
LKDRRASTRPASASSRSVRAPCPVEHFDAIDATSNAGDIIKADAETFDPDNKIIWRLHADTPTGEKGNWMYAPVRGPKTAVPLNEALLKRVEEGVKFYKVNGKKGTIVRKAAAMDSDKVQIIESGTVVSVVATTELDNGKVRYEIDEPVQGWVTSTQVDRWYKELPRSAFAK